MFYYYLYLQKNYMDITKSTKSLSFDDAVELYNSGNDDDKAIALFFFDEEDLKNSFVDFILKIRYNHGVFYTRDRFGGRPKSLWIKG